MRCLHICNDFSLTKVHSNLYSNLDRLGLEQIVFNPVREETPVGNNTIDFVNSNSQIIYSAKLKKSHRILFRSKIRFLYRDLERKCDLAKLDLIHATTLFSDGAVALKVKEKFGIPYMVTVRATDVDLFFKVRPDLSYLAYKIIREASKIIFISDSLRLKFLKSRLVTLSNLKPDNKCVIMYNGIDNFWLDHTSAKKQDIPTNIIFVGRLIGRKNLTNLIQAVIRIRETGRPVQLTIVGEGSEMEEEIREADRIHPFIQYCGGVYDKNELVKIYRQNHIFALPARAETFGLVYIEALTQGLPILYCKNEGVDGVFTFVVGSSCKNGSTEEIINGLINIMDNYSNIDLSQIDFSQFRWENISKQYLNMYKAISEC